MRRRWLARLLTRERDAALAAMRMAEDWPWQTEPDPRRREMIRLDGQLQGIIDWLEGKA